MFERPALGVLSDETFLSGNVGGGLKWYAPNKRWGLRGDYRFAMTKGKDDAHGPLTAASPPRRGHHRKDSGAVRTGSRRWWSRVAVAPREALDEAQGRTWPYPMTPRLIRVTMGTAAIMGAHLVAAKALRDTTFLTSGPATALPLMMTGTAVFTAALVPVFSRLIRRFSSIRVVALGFALSATAHLLEWVWYDASRWTAVIIYLHLAGASAVLLSGFWSLVAERFNPAGARAAFGRIGAAGTAGGLAGSIAAERIASTLSPGAVLVLLAMLHGLCVFGLEPQTRADLAASPTSV